MAEDFNGRDGTGSNGSKLSRGWIAEELEALLRKAVSSCERTGASSFDCHAVKNKVTDAVNFGYLTRRLVNSTRRGRIAMLKRVRNDF